jgi:hypothetical protein
MDHRSVTLRGRWLENAPIVHQAATQHGVQPTCPAAAVERHFQPLSIVEVARG